MAIDREKLLEFAERFTAAAKTSELREGWDWSEVGDVTDLAAQALGFTDSELTQLRYETGEDEVVTLEKDSVYIQFTGAWGADGDGVTIGESLSDEEPQELLDAAVILINGHLLGDDGIDSDEVSRAWSRVEAWRNSNSPGLHR